jgi:hypothetical protein
MPNIVDALIGENFGPPKRESDGFLQGAHYLYNYSDLACAYWKAMSESKFIEVYGEAFAAFTKDDAFPVQMFHELHGALHMEGVEQTVRTMKIARIITSWFEKMLHIFCNYSRPVPVIDPLEDVLSSKKRSSPHTFSSSIGAEDPEVPQQASNAAEQSRAIAFISLKMKDILAMPILSEKIGVDKVYLLKMLVGPLHGINLRNLLWHGFVAPCEWPSYHTCLLFGILLSLALEFKEQVQTERYKKMLTQVQTNIDFFDPYLLQTSPVVSPDGGVSDGTLPILELAQQQRSQIVQLISTSPFCQNGFKSEWIHGLDMVLEGRNFEALVIFFPLLEASLRRVYVDAKTQEE